MEARASVSAGRAGRSACFRLGCGSAEVAFTRISPRWAPKSGVLSFIAKVTNAGVPSRAVVASRYGIAGRYFLVANQFWAHKNHKQIIDSLRILKARGIVVPVLATGKSFDHRWPDFFDDLMRYADAGNVLDCFRVLGVVPRHDLIALMKHAVAILNPSRFEGWNTSIEEAKTLGVRVIASDIPVHREQARPGAIYVD